MEEEAGLREQPGPGRRRGEPRSAAAHADDRRLVSALPDPHPRHAERGLAMMVKGKMGPGGRRARPQAEPFAQGRGRVRRQDHLLMEIVADYVAASTHAAVSIGVSRCREPATATTRRSLFQKANEDAPRIDGPRSVFLCLSAASSFNIVSFRHSTFTDSNEQISHGKTSLLYSFDRLKSVLRANINPVARIF